MSIAVTSFNIVCCSNGRVFTYSKVWRNQLNRLGNTFIHKNVPASKLRTNEICLVFLWMFSVATFSKRHVVFGISPESEHGRHADHVPYHPISNKQATCLFLRQYLENNFAYSFCFTCYEHKIWTYTSFQCLPKLILNLLIMKIVFDCCCFTMVRSYKHLTR